MSETYQQCNNCGSTDIDKQSGAMGVHTCNSCGSAESISWRTRDDTPSEPIIKRLARVLKGGKY